MSPHVVVVGAGAAGLVAAAAAREAGARVTVLESTTDGGRKILISGGGRCNVLPDDAAPERFVSDSPRTLVRALLRGWPLREQRAFFEHQVGVPLALEADSGKWFPASNRARDVRDGLVSLAISLGVVFRFSSPVTRLQTVDGAWTVDTPGGPVEADRVVLATGGLSVPATGSTGAGLVFARALGHVVHPTYAALTPLRTDPVVHAALAGVSLDVSIEARSATEQARSRGGFLFTHRGYSGPAVLDVSHVAVRSQTEGATHASVKVAWTALDRDGWAGHLTSARGLVATAVAARVPQRLAEMLVHQAGVAPGRTCVQLRRDERERLLVHLTAFELPWTGDEGFRTAEVTGGGVALDEVHRATLESKRIPGLYFCGELLDAFGPIGGHNFSWAWSTGRIAGLGAARVR